MILVAPFPYPRHFVKKTPEAFVVKKIRAVIGFDKIGKEDVPAVGGKNASLGEMVRFLAPKGIAIPEGFATTADAYWKYLEHNHLKEKIAAKLSAMSEGELALSEAGNAIRRLILGGEFPESMASEIISAYRALGDKSTAVAIRSSATAEDLPHLSFAGQQESYLNVRGKDQLLKACKKCLASLFTDRAIAYRETHAYAHMQVALSIGIQKMVRSDKGASGVVFTIDTETGFPKIVLINGIYGLGELIVKGKVEPDQFMVYKPHLQDSTLVPIIEKSLGHKKKKMVYAETKSAKGTRVISTSQREKETFCLSDAQVVKLAKWATLIEEHYAVPMDIEWALDDKGDLFIVQARPETVYGGAAKAYLTTYSLQGEGNRVVKGLSVGKKCARGKVCVLESPRDARNFRTGDILVTEMTDPDWVPIMKKAAGIVTNHGGRTSHAAIVSRELGIPAVVGTGNATRILTTGQTVTVSCVEGEEGYVYDGNVQYREEKIRLDTIPKTQTKVMVNMADPAAALIWWQLPADGVGLARMEFVINNHIQVHPMALVDYDKVESPQAKRKIKSLIRGYQEPTQFFVDNLAFGLSKIAAVHYPNPVIVRLSDFKTNEYARLIGGKQFEPKEENPMLGWRGASRYYHADYRKGFELECRALVKARDEIGMTNIQIMIPFCRTPEEADRVIEIMKTQGLERGHRDLELLMMCEIPSNVVLVEEFAKRFDGFSIGSNDLTQLVLGVDRDAERIAHLFDERNLAVKKMIGKFIERAHRAKCHVGICGQAPSDYPEFAQFLVSHGIDSISVLPDSFLATKKIIAETETARKLTR
jgi:pyruvate, water dikinase